jgi:hypothetical protein
MQQANPAFLTGFFRFSSVNCYHFVTKRLFGPLPHFDVSAWGGLIVILLLDVFGARTAVARRWEAI